MIPQPPKSKLFPYTTLFRSFPAASVSGNLIVVTVKWGNQALSASVSDNKGNAYVSARSEEHTSELQSQSNLVCRLLLEKKKKKKLINEIDHINKLYTNFRRP